MAGRMLSTRQAAEFLGLNEKKVYSLARAGRIPAVRLTGKWLFPQATLAEWLEGRARQGVGMGAGAVKEGASPPPAVAALVVAGSDDPLFRSLLRDMNLQPERGLLAFAELGSAGGLRALAGGLADLACSHLEEEGEYNLPFLPRLAPGVRGRMVTVAHRRQGILTAPRNPLGLRSVADLARRPGVRIVNRQPGSGTRLLLDSELRKAGVEPESLPGYRTEVSTHEEAALRVLRGEADAAIACEWAGRQAGLGFVPLREERFDLIVPREAGKRAAEGLVQALRAPSFHRRGAAWPGYDLRETGVVQAEF